MLVKGNEVSVESAQVERWMIKKLDLIFSISSV